jgi:hypothetical protein
MGKLRVSSIELKIVSSSPLSNSCDVTSVELEVEHVLEGEDRGREGGEL